MTIVACQFLNCLLKDYSPVLQAQINQIHRARKCHLSSVGTGRLFSFLSYSVAQWHLSSILTETNRHPSKCTHEIETIWNVVWKRARKTCNKWEKCKRKTAFHPLQTHQLPALRQWPSKPVSFQPQNFCNIKGQPKFVEQYSKFLLLRTTLNTCGCTITKLLTK